VAAASEALPSLKKRKITPHTWRHTVGVHLTALGIYVVTIRNLLGHAGLETTNLYARSDLCSQRKAHEQVDGSMRAGKPPRCKRDTELLAWLDALCPKMMGRWNGSIPAIAMDRAASIASSDTFH
jgi:hypothetical protein